MTRQTQRRIAFKTKKHQDRLAEKQSRLETLKSFRADRAPWSLVNQGPSATVLMASPSARKHRSPGRRIIHTSVETVPGCSTIIDRRRVVLVPERQYETAVHATKGIRRTRLPA